MLPSAFCIRHLFCDQCNRWRDSPSLWERPDGSRGSWSHCKCSRGKREFSPEPQHLGWCHPHSRWLFSLEIPFQTWPKLHPLSDSKPSQADNEEHSFSTEGRIEVEMLQLPCSPRPLSFWGLLLQWEICQTPGACFQTCFTQVLLPSSKRRNC